METIVAVCVFRDKILRVSIVGAVGVVLVAGSFAAAIMIDTIGSRICTLRAESKVNTAKLTRT